MSVTVRKALKDMLKDNRPTDSAVKIISSRSLSLFQEELAEIALFVSKEATNGNYHTLSPIDIKRGFDKWHEEKIQGKLRLAIG